MKWYIRAFRKYAVFSGRDSRKAFWMFVLIHVLVTLAVGFVDAALMGLRGTLPEIVPDGILLKLYALVAFLPSLAITVRRLHDAGYSGWHLLLDLIPLVGPIIVVMILALRGEEGPNRYGPPPEK